MIDRQLRSQRVRTGLRTWFRSPPRRHGEVIYDREVSFLELFYDLTYVVLIGRATHHLAGNISWGGVGEFAVIFGLIWLAWFNGTFWHELHAREDGRARLYIFVQMGLLALLTVFTEGAAGADGQAFAITYGVLFVLFTWQWYLVHRIDDPQYRPTTTRYLTGMGLTVVAMGASAFIADGRLVIWALVVLYWLIGGVAMMSRSRTVGYGEGLTASVVERVGLFMIIVLGEFIVGVVSGISDAEARGARTIVTGMVGLTIAMGLWWNYFDLLGRRVPGRRGLPLAAWLYVNLPMTMAIAAGGAAMVNIVEHASADRTAAPAAWLLSGSVAVVLLGLAVAATALPADAFPPGMSRHITPALCSAAAATLVLGGLRPTPIAFVALISLALGAAWTWLFTAFIALGGLAHANPERPHDR